MTLSQAAPRRELTQFKLLDKVAATLRTSPSVSSLLVRGSLAKGTPDLYSDIDIVVGLEEGDLEQFTEILDALMSVELCALFPGWQDTYIGKLGGLGYVYLVVFEDKVYEVDLYLVPQSRVASLAHQTGAKLLHGSLNGTAHQPIPAAFIEQQFTRKPSTFELFIETLILMVFIRKRLIRGQHFILYGDTMWLCRAVKDLIRNTLAPESEYWGWYQLPEELGATDEGAACLHDLKLLIARPQFQSQTELLEVFDTILGIVRRIAPETLTSMGPVIARYRSHLESN